MLVKVTEKYYIIYDLKLREICKVSKNNNLAYVKKMFNIIGYLPE